MDINTFINKLQSYQSENVFNPWRDYDADTEIGPQASAIRRENLRRYLELRPNAHYLFIAEQYERTSKPTSTQLNATQRAKGFNEPTDTVVWSTLQQHGLAAFDVILWNIFPWHPHKEHKLLTNRTPSTTELDVRVECANLLLELVPHMQIVAIGQKAADTLSRYGIACKAVRHPSMGGAETFRAQVAELFKKQQK